MVYKYWDSITVRVQRHFSIQLLSTLTYSPRQREDLEFSVGSKVAVWEVKDPLLTSGGATGGADYEEDTTSTYHAGGGASLVGGVSGGQYYYGAKGSGGYAGAQRGYPPTPDRY